jgi:hypothetical protein
VATLNQQQHEVEDDEDCDEKKFKEEIVLIGEKCDIESLLDNQNNQLFNLILANSNRSKQLSNMESDLNRERYNRLKRDDGKTKTMASDDDIQIEIEYQDRDAEQAEWRRAESEQKRLLEKKKYEGELRDVAKYLVDEITKISVNKLKIDKLNDTLDQKFFVDDILTRHEILNNLIEVWNSRFFWAKLYLTNLHSPFLKCE